MAELDWQDFDDTTYSAGTQIVLACPGTAHWIAVNNILLNTSANNVMRLYFKDCNGTETTVWQGACLANSSIPVCTGAVRGPEHADLWLTITGASTVRISGRYFMDWNNRTLVP